MTNITLDTTYDYGKSLKKANIPEHQIDALVARDQQTTQLILNTLDEKFATKNDLEKFATKSDLKHEIQDLKHEIETKFATKNDMKLLELKIEDSRLATKHDISLVQKYVEELRLVTKKDLSILKQSIIIWLGCAIIGSTLFTIGVLGFLIQMSH